MSSQKQSIGEFFAEKSVLIVGGTGFVGKALVEKLLRSCPLIATVYVLIRPKGGQRVKERLKVLLSSSVFDCVREICGEEQLEKVVGVCGDVTYEGLGLSATDKQLLLESVSVVVNTAATIRFDEPLRRALHLNVLSAQRVLRLVKTFTRLQAFIHVSTAYCTRDKRDVSESVAIETVSPNKLLSAAEWMDDTLLRAIEEHVLSGRPSTYHLTKALAEQLLSSEGEDIPLAIVRPSIITGAWREPMAGWVDNYNGLTGYLVAAGKGVLRSMHVQSSYVCDIIPVDIVVNTCISAAHSVATNPHSSPLVLNCTSGSLTWADIRSLSLPALTANPSLQLFRYPGPRFHSRAWLHTCHAFVEHTIPAFLVDLLFRACGLSPILGPVYQKLNRSLSALQYFTCNEWTFKRENFKRLERSLSLSDRELFPTDVTRIDWKQYFFDYVLAIRLHLLREKSESLPEARHRIRRLFWLQEMTKGLIFLLFLFSVYKSLRK